jgi:hypothetical protein
MLEILDELDAALDEGRRVYLHCRAGIGRTNVVVGCWLARRGYTGEAALDRLNALWQSSSRARPWPYVPETGEQEASSRLARTGARGAPRRAGTEAPTAGCAAGYRGMLLGLAAGDAAGQPLVTVGPAASRRSETCSVVGRSSCRVAPGATRRPWRCASPRASSPGVAWTSATRSRAMRCGSARGWARAPASASASARRRRAPWRRPSGPGSRAPARTTRRARTRSRSRGSGPPWPCTSDPREALEAAVECARVTHQAPVTLDAVRYFAGAARGCPAGRLARPNCCGRCSAPWRACGTHGRSSRRCWPSRRAAGATRRRRASTAAPRRRPRSRRRCGPSIAAPRCARRCLPRSTSVAMPTRRRDHGQLAGACHGAEALPAGVAGRAGRARTDRVAGRPPAGRRRCGADRRPDCAYPRAGDVAIIAAGPRRQPASPHTPPQPAQPPLARPGGRACPTRSCWT